ncbi:MAG TPA: hypothetical protein VMP89_14545, partial [Solirubrobacteraceae bacterium]|nr:hypothetical protein [Solirubrobacteraceae bacterium]
RARRRQQQALLLLMLVLLLRFALDPWDISYYSLPFLIALVVWETLSFDRAPVFALFASAASWFVSEWGTALGRLPADDRALIFMALVVPAIVAILAALYAPGLGEQLSPRIRRRPALLNAAPPGAELA